MQEVYDFLKKCGTYYLATVDGDKPKVRPFGTIDIRKVSQNQKSNAKRLVEIKTLKPGDLSK